MLDVDFTNTLIALNPRLNPEMDNKAVQEIEIGLRKNGTFRLLLKECQLRLEDNADRTLCMLPRDALMETVKICLDYMKRFNDEGTEFPDGKLASAYLEEVRPIRKRVGPKDRKGSDSGDEEGGDIDDDLDGFIERDNDEESDSEDDGSSEEEEAQESGAEGGLSKKRRRRGSGSGKSRKHKRQRRIRDNRSFHSDESLSLDKWNTKVLSLLQNQMMKRMLNATMSSLNVKLNNVFVKKQRWIYFLRDLNHRSPSQSRHL